MIRPAGTGRGQGRDSGGQDRKSSGMNENSPFRGVRLGGFAGRS